MVLWFQATRAYTRTVSDCMCIWITHMCRGCSEGNFWGTCPERSNGPGAQKHSIPKAGAECLWPLVESWLQVQSWPSCLLEDMSTQFATERPELDFQFCIYCIHKDHRCMCCCRLIASTLLPCGNLAPRHCSNFGQKQEQGHQQLHQPMFAAADCELCLHCKWKTV